MDVAYTRGFEKPVRDALSAGNLGYGVQAGLTLGLPNVASVTLGFGVSVEPRQLDYARTLLAWRAIQRLEAVAETGRDYIVVVDEYRDVTEGELYALVEKIADPLGALHIKLVERLGSTVKLYITTSDSMVASRISRSTVKYRSMLLWNLPMGSFEEVAWELSNMGLMEELRVWARSLGLSLEELAWSLFGSNVRELLEASSTGLIAWLNNLIGVVRRAITTTMRSRNLTEEAIMRELRSLAERGAEELSILKVYLGLLVSYRTFTEANLRFGRLQVRVVREARCGEEVRWSHRGRGPPALKGDAPSMGNPIGGMRSARPSGDPTNRSGRPSIRLGLLGCGEGVTMPC